MSVSPRPILQICGGTCVIRRDFSAGWVEKMVVDLGSIGLAFWLWGAPRIGFFHVVVTLEARKNIWGNAISAWLNKRPNHIFVFARQIPCLFWVANKSCRIHVLQCSVFYCHILQSIIGPGEENATWKVKFSSEILQLRFKIKSSFCQGQTPPKELYSERDNSPRGSDCLCTFLWKGSTLS